MASKAKGKGKTAQGASPSSRPDRKGAKFKDAKKTEGKDSLAYKILSSTQTKELAELETVQQVSEKMVEIMKLSQHDVDLKEAAMLDFYTSGFWWSKEQNHSPEQMSAFFTVLHTVLENLTEKQMCIVENLKEYKKLLVGIGHDNTEISGGLDCFDVLQAKAISDYLYISFFQHYKLYEFTFSHNQAEEIIGTDLIVEVAPPADAPWPPPLEEGVAEEIYKEHIATPPSTPVVQAEEEKVDEGVDDAASGAEEGAVVTGGDREADLLAQLSPEEVKAIMQSVFDEMLTGLQTEVAQRLRDKENAFINRINKIHKVAEKS